ncbi:MAG: helix-turn-helix transcriptional regulator, partial [Kiritimatiellae bacterium]|nr:helix-turn-helix transcriptional regulator [Kiritimatiellia bacterium]
TEHGCENISVADVAETMGCCGRLAEKLFRKHAKMSILDAIRKTRMDKVLYLLKNRAIPIDAIPFQCGYGASPAFLKTYFKKQTGMTMREWRNKNQ